MRSDHRREPGNVHRGHRITSARRDVSSGRSTGRVPADRRLSTSVSSITGASSCTVDPGAVRLSREEAKPDRAVAFDRSRRASAAPRPIPPRTTPRASGRACPAHQPRSFSGKAPANRTAHRSLRSRRVEVIDRHLLQAQRALPASNDWIAATRSMICPGTAQKGESCRKGDARQTVTRRPSSKWQNAPSKGREDARTRR